MKPALNRSLRRCAAGLMAVLVALPSFAQVRLPSLGESASLDLTVGAERRLGEQIMREARRDPLYLDDPVLLEYLQSLWRPLVNAARKVGNIDADTEHSFAWEAFLVKDRSVNAFALPGGFVGMHLGLIALTTTPDQLASVLAHELTHVTQRHIARSIAPQQQASIMAIAGMLLGMIAASRSGNTDMANAAMMGGQGAAVQSQLNFSRDVEREADRIGYGLMAEAGYSVGGMAAMFERMDLATRLNDSGGFPYLRSHPLTVDRISEARNRTLLAGSAANQQPTLLHAMMQMRARALMDDSAQSLQRLNGSTSSTQLADRVGALYGGALGALLLRDHERAERQLALGLQAAATAQPREPRAEAAWRLLQSQVLLARGQAGAAQQALEQLPPGLMTRPALLQRAQVALALHRGDAAAAALPLRASTEALQTWVAEHPTDGAGWELLSATSEALGLRLRSMRAGAEARAAVGDLNGAIDRLRAAQASPRTASAGGQDFIEASVIDTRLRQLTAQRRQWALEARGENGRGPSRDDPPID